MFPASIEGEFELRPLTPNEVDEILADVERALDQERAGWIRRDGNSVTFRGGLFRFRIYWNWNVLAPVGFGRIEVVPGTPGVVRYDLSTVELLVTATAMAAFIAVSIVTTERTLLGLAFAGFGWAWLFGGNYVTASARLPDFVRRAVRVEAQSVGSRACPNCGTRYNPADYRPDAPEKRCEFCNGLLEPANQASPPPA